jgi:hypothetical protein
MMAKPRGCGLVRVMRSRRFFLSMLVMQALAQGGRGSTPWLRWRRRFNSADVERLLEALGDVSKS